MGALTIISLPWPAKELSPNGRFHRMAVHRAKKADERAAWALTMEAVGCVGFGLTLLTVTFNPPDRRRYDLDNCVARAKGLQDGLALALGCDDSTFRPEYRFGNPHKGGRVVVEIGDAP